MNVTTTLPTSGTVLGALVDDFQLHLRPESVKKSAREFFAGRRQTIKGETRARIITAIAVALVDQGFVPSFGELPKELPTRTTEDVLARAISACAQQWDELVGQLESDGLRQVSREVAAVACLRLVVVDLAIRAAAAVRLASGRPADCDCDLCVFGDFVQPKWPLANGRQLCVRAILDEIGGKGREALADKLGIADSAIDAWLHAVDPSRPSPMAIETLARALAALDPQIAEASASWSFGIRWRLALGALSDRVAQIVGRTRTIDIGWALERCHLQAAEFFRGSRLPDDRFRIAMLTDLLLGVRGPSVEHVLSGLAKGEPLEEWSHAIRASGNDWLIAVTTSLRAEQSKARIADILVQSAHSLAEARLVAELFARDTSTGLHPARLTSSSATGHTLLALAFKALESGDLATAAVHLAGAAAENPSQPELHQDLGAVLGKLGRFDEALAACRKAVDLRADWSIPLVQIGIILLDAGRNEQARAHLEGLVGRIEWSATFEYILGNSRLQTERYEAARAAFERVLQENGNHALALDAAAHCCLMLGDWSQGHAYAKRARSLGRHTTWAAFKSGAYRRISGSEASSKKQTGRGRKP